MENPKKPFKIICTNCNNEIEKKYSKVINLDKEPIDIVGRPYYDSATVSFECECGNEIEV